MTASVSAEQLLYLQTQLAEARRLAKFAIAFMAPASPGRLAAEQVAASWEDPAVEEGDGEP